MICRTVATIPAIALVLCGCGTVSAIRNTPTYAKPTGDPPPSGSIAIEPKITIVSKRKAIYEWQVICDRHYSSFQGINTLTRFSGSSTANRLAGVLPTVETVFVEVETKPHGDGTMAVTITQGHRSMEQRPLFEPSAKPLGGGYGMGGTTSDGHKEAPAASFVLPIVTARTVVRLPAKIDLGTIVVPRESFGMLEVTDYNSNPSKTVFRKSVPLDAKGEFPLEAFSAPDVRWHSRKKGFQATATGGAAAHRDAVRLEVDL